MLHARKFMKGRFLIVMAMTVLLCVMTGLGYADEGTDVEGVTVPPPSLSASRIYQTQDRAAENITVVTKEQIAAMPANNLAEVLSYVAGMSIDTRTGFGHGVTYGMHAAKPQDIRVMIDGVDFNTQISGQAGIEAIPLHNIERIDIIKGALSSKWGSALGGVINIITKDTGHSLIPKGSVTTIISEHDQQHYLAEVQGGTQGFGYFSSAEYGSADGIRPDDDTLQRSGFTKMSYEYGDLARLATSVGYINSAWNGGLPYGLRERKAYYSRYGNISLDITSTDRVELHVQGKTNHQTDSSADPNTPRSEYHDKMWGLDSSALIHFREQDTVIVGFDAEYDGLKSVGNIPNQVSQHTEAFYTNYNVVSGPFSGSVGVRYDRHSEFDDQVSPSAGMVYQIPGLSKTRIRASIARGYNAPPLLWVLYDNASFQSNANLKPERSWTEEVGIETNPLKWFCGKINLFYSRVQDGITPEDTDGDAYTDQYRNNSKLRRQGIELEVKVMPHRDFSIMASGIVNDVRDNNGDNIYSTAYARNAAKLGFFYHNTYGTRASLMGTYYRYRVINPYNNPHERQMLWDAKLAQKIPIWRDVSCEGFVNLHNILNSKYYADEFYPHPSRYFEGGVTVRF